MKKRQLDNTTLDNVVLLRDKGLPQETIASIVGVGLSSVGRALQIAAFAKDKDIDGLRRMEQTSASMVECACGKYGVSLDNPTGKTPEVKQADNTAQAFLALLDAVKEQTDAIKELTKAVNTIDNRLNQMHLVLSGFRGDVGERIKTVVEAINVNGNILTKEHERQTEHLNMIRSQTKKRPWQEGMEK